MIDEALAKIATLKRAGQHEEAYGEAVALSQALPNNARAQAAAAYAADRVGRDAEAVTFYERAFELGSPEDDRSGFLLGYGATLQSVGRLEEAVAVLRKAALQYPSDTALRAFLALALHAYGKHTEAMATLLDAALTAAREDGFGYYDRALREYQEQLSIASGSENCP